jgi:hypothetical protein
VQNRIAGSRSNRRFGKVQSLVIVLLRLTNNSPVRGSVLQKFVSDHQGGIIMTTERKLVKLNIDYGHYPREIYRSKDPFEGYMTLIIKQL